MIPRLAARAPSQTQAETALPEQIKSGRAYASRDVGLLAGPFGSLTKTHESSFLVMISARPGVGYRARETPAVPCS